MPFIAQTLISHPRVNLAQGASADHLPPDLLSQFVADGLVKQAGQVDEAMPGFEEQDRLTPLNRQELIDVMRNNFPAGTFKVMKNYSDEQIRELIRKVSPDLTSLVIDSDLPADEEEPENL